MRSHELLCVSGLMFLSLLAVHCGSDKRPDIFNQGTGGTKGGGTAGTNKNGGGSNVSTGTGTGNDPGIYVATDPPGTASCGNGKDDGASEECDDGNKDGGDGCTSGCRREDGWDCPKTGKCTRVTKCGDGKLTSDETCDDGNTSDGDGCSADCKKIEEHWVCRVPGKKCVPECGDNFIVKGMEKCDDGNTDSGDGCSSTCVLEPGYTCTDPPDSKCTKSECGNGKVEAGENCDNGKDKNGLFFGDGSGCSKTCTSEPKCRDDKGVTGACKTSCGDRNIDPDEECDDGNGDDNDGCSHDCKVEKGFNCGDPKEDTDLEECSKGGGKCLILPITFRDFDGQDASKGHPDFFFMGKGSPKTTCVPNASGRTADDNGTCPGTDAEPLCSGLVNATLGADGKPALGSKTECKCTYTDWDGTGVLSGAGAKTCSDSGGNSHDVVKSVNVKVIKDATSFKQWYSDSDFSTKYVKTLELKDAGNGLYQFSSSDGRTVYDDLDDIFNGDGTSLHSGFFDLDDATGTGSTKYCNLWPYWVGLTSSNCKTSSSNPVTQQWDPRGWNGGECTPDEKKPSGTAPGCPLKNVKGEMHNFYMTTEVRYYFRFVGGETLQFYGDDDVWVFINGHLALDLGAPHERLRGKVVLPKAGGKNGSWAITTTDIVTSKDVAIADGDTPDLGLESGKTYEIAVFHADRHLRENNYQLTLQGFSSKHSECEARCGDGIATPTEECDDGDNNKDKDSDEAYGNCTTECKFGPWCGDGVKNGDEECDKGKDNGGAYGDEDGCTLGCLKTHRCGDGHVDGDHGEACDNGAENGKADSWCLATCQVRTVQN